MADMVSGIDRLARRHAAGSLVVSMIVSEPDRRMRSTQPIALAVDVKDLSIMGAQLEGPALGHITPGTIVEISVGSHRGAAEIRHSRPSDIPGRAVYGVHFLDQGNLSDAINGIVDALQSPAASVDPWGR